MKLLKYPKNLIIGKNNYIEKGVKIFDNVIIGNNNKIYNGTLIYPNTKIGNDNIFLNNNIIGEHPIQAKENFNKKKFGGVEIGNNNFFHISNKIYSGYSFKTIINNNNKILGETHIGHDVNIHNNVNIYTRGMLCGYVKMLNYSGIGVSAILHQNTIIGNYSFIGMNNTITKNSFPFFININNKYSKLNLHRIKETNLLSNYEEKILNEILLKYLKNNLVLDEYKNLLSQDIYNIIKNYLSYK
jgi:UDP-N-acetylglucosamine acyltransferase